MARFLEENSVERPGQSVSLWRYMSLSKFMHMIQNQTIWFSCINTLLKDDPYEGSLPFSYMEHHDAEAIAKREKNLRIEQGSTQKSLRSMEESFKNNRGETFVSCWHSGVTDNDAMWRLYGAENDGSVCVQTTVARASRNLPEWVSIGRVTYTSYDEPWDVPLNAYTPFFRKRLCFEHEKEVRFLVNKKLDIQTQDFKGSEHGMPLVVNLNDFLLRVYVSPTSPEWFEGVVGNAIYQAGLSLPFGPAPMSRKAAI